jgi:hypothetical protein
MRLPRWITMLERAFSGNQSCSLLQTQVPIPRPATREERRNPKGSRTLKVSGPPKVSRDPQRCRESFLAISPPSPPLAPGQTTRAP